ncbi:ATP-sensitive inward rectifier potassium channel 12, partial [Armadillidium nasatum]
MKYKQNLKPWRWTLLIFALSFVLSWILFAAVWYSILYHHGDFLPEHLPDRQAETGWTPCVHEIINFASCFLFSAFMGGVIFTKLSRPKKRTHTLIFSREACICQRDGELCLMFRVGDMRKSHIIEAHIRVQLIRERITEEGEIIPYYQYELDVGYDGGEDRILFIWPMTIVHRIDESSPLYELSAHDLLQEKFEIVVMLEGVIENTGMTIQARSSYLPCEIKWGYRFRPMLSFKEDIGECSVDYSLFNSSYEVATPLCSARYLQESSISDYAH